MLIVPPPKFPRRRRRKPRASVATAGPLAVTAIGDVAAFGQLMQFTATLNTTEADPLVFDNPPDPAKWRARYQGKRYSGVLVSSPAYNQLIVGLQYVEDEAGADQVEYLNNPSDIADANGRRLGAFERTL